MRKGKGAKMSEVKRVLASVVATAILLTGCGQARPTPKLVDPSEFNVVMAMTSCAALQAKFDTAYAGNQAAKAGTLAAQRYLEWMEISQYRMDEIHCP